jgi:hypothetical protein
MAEGPGFEPGVEGMTPLQPLSRRPLSTTQATLRLAALLYHIGSPCQVLERGCSEMQLLPPPVGSPHCVRGTQNAVFGFPPLREGNRANLKEGVRNFAYFQTPSVLERAIL